MDTVNSLLSIPPPHSRLSTAFATAEPPLNFPLSSLLHFSTITFRLSLFVPRLKTSLTCNLRFFMKLKS